MIISSIYTNEELNNIASYLDGAILMAPRFAINYSDLDLDLAIKHLKDNNKKIILGIDKIFTEDEIDSGIEFINKYKNDSDISFYVSDLGLIKYAKDLKIESRFIYDPKTMITNYMDAKVYKSFGIDALGISNEITLEDVIKIKEETDNNYLYLVFGKRIMFYSKRMILDIYNRKMNINNTDSKLYITELEKDSLYPVIENENGLSIYRDYFINLAKEIDKIKDLKYLYLDSFDLDNKLYQEIIKSYYLYLNFKISQDELINNINSLNLNIKDGFTYKDTIYQKEEIEDGKN